MTKKILALALAGTTAFSVFASAMSVNAAPSATDPEAFGSTAPRSEYAAYTPTALALNSGVLSIGGTKLDTTVQTDVEDFKALVAKLVLVEDYSAVDDVEIKAGKIYLLDYELDGDDEGAGNSADFDALEAVLENVAALTDDYAGSGAYSSASIAATVTTAVKNYLKDDGSTTFTLANNQGNSGSFRRTVYDAFDDLSPSAADNFKEADTDKYNYGPKATAGTLLKAIDDATPLSYQTSQLMYLIQEYNRIVELMTPADSTTSEEKIERYIGVLDARAVEDYDKASSYTAFLGKYEKHQEDYASASTASKLSEYAGKLYTLMTDNTGKSAGVNKDDLKAIIDVAASMVKSDYVKAGRDSDDWDYFAAIRTEANAIYKLSKSGSYQSTVDAYTTLLSEAIDALEPGSSVTDWLMLRIETAVNDAEALVETDYTTASWKTLQSKLTSAQKVLESARPSKTTIENAAEALEKAIKDLKVKPVSAASRKELKTAIEDAKDALTNLGSNATGYQATALTKAISEADDLWSTKYTTLDPDTTISDVEAAITALEAAMTSAGQPQGWYTTADGKWMYGEGDGYYVDGWKKIGNFWFNFDANGVAKQNEWMSEGGKWYYFGNSCVAYAGWGKVDGSWYYFDKGNAMCTGWIKLGNTWYYLDPTSGKMVTGWATIGGTSYYFSTESSTLGAMLVSTTTPDGYTVDANGAWVK